MGWWERLWAMVSALPATRALRMALAIWFVYGAIIAIVVAVQPERHTATLEYQWASAKWWGGEKSLYKKKNGYLYLPQFAILYTPYEFLPDRVGEPLWRLTCMALLASALWVAASALAGEKRAQVFLIATVLALPSSFASARNGQVNMPLAALFLLTAIAISRERWWPAAAMLAVALVLKPIALAPILLCAALYPRLILPGIACLAVVAALPFAHPNPSYAANEYVAFFKNLNQAGNPKGQTWCDFAGMLGVAGIQIPSAIQLGIRALAGLVALGIGWHAVRTMDRLRGAVAVLFASVVYLMLFNPRTETNSYVMLGAFVGVLGAYDALVARNLRAAGWFVLVAAILGTENYGWPIFPLTNLWLKALSTSVLCLIVPLAILRPGRSYTFLAPAPAERCD